MGGRKTWMPAKERVKIRHLPLSPKGGGLGWGAGGNAQTRGTPPHSSLPPLGEKEQTAAGGKAEFFTPAKTGSPPCDAAGVSLRGHDGEGDRSPHQPTKCLSIS